MIHIKTARVILCDVQGTKSLYEIYSDLESSYLEPLLGAIAEAYNSAFSFSKQSEAPRPQQGFGDSVWWMMLGDSPNWIGALKSYALFAAHLLAPSCELPFVLIAPVVVSEGIGYSRDHPWTLTVSKEKVAAFAAEGVPVDWQYSNAMEDAWKYSAVQVNWRRGSQEPAPMLVRSESSITTIQRDIAEAFCVSEDLVKIDTLLGCGQGVIEKVRDFRVSNCLELVVRYGVSIGTLETHRMEQLAILARDFAFHHNGQPAATQLEIAKVLDKVRTSKFPTN
jgi:hypothetical protein